jgi:hypothetical protein
MSGDSNNTNNISCGDANQRETQFGEQIGLTVANLFGFGGLIEQAFPTPLDKLQSQLGKTQSKTQGLVNQMSLKFATLQATFDDDVTKLFTEIQKVLEEENAFHDEILTEKISTNGLYIACIFTIVIIIWLFILIK